MKIVHLFTASLLLTLPLAFVSCDKDEKEDDSKSFTMTANLPEDTAESDAVYIVGEFNGGVEYALGNPRWELKGTATKRSITIDPKDYVGGKTIDDIWCIQSPTRGVEVVSPGVPMLRQGKSKEINVVAWEKAAGPSFDPSGVWTVVGTINDWNEKVGIEMTHEGSTWVVKGLHLRADDQFKFVMDGSWATNFGAGAPGTTFTAELNEEFDVQADGGNIKAAAGYYDIYLYPFEAKAKLVDGGDEPGPEPKPVTSVAITPSHAEMQVGDTWIFTFAVTPSDAEVKSFRWESSNPSVATVDQEGLVSAVGVGEASISVTVDGCTTDVPVTVTEDVPPQPTEGPTVYIYNATGWENIYLYGWIQDLGDVDNTPWPGLGYSNFEVFNGHAFFRFDLNENWSAGEINLIFNNNSEAQTPDYPITMTGGKSYYLYVKPDAVTPIDDPNTFEPDGPSGDPATIYAYDGNAWGSMNLYIWKQNPYTDWPGMSAEGTEQVHGHTFFKFTVPGSFCSDTENLNVIFDDGSNQTDDLAFVIAPGQTYYFNVVGSTAEIIDPSNFNPAEPPVKDGSWGIAGTMNGWKAENAIAMEVIGDYYVAKGVTLTADAEFKFVQDKSWKVNRGGTFVKLGESFDLYQDGDNIKPGLSGTYDIYIKSDGSSAYIPAP